MAGAARWRLNTLVTPFSPKNSLVAKYWSGGGHERSGNKEVDFFPTTTF